MKKRYFIYLLIVILLIFYFSFKSREESNKFTINIIRFIDNKTFLTFEQSVYLVRKLGHIIIYFILSLIIFKIINKYLYTIIICLIISIIDELIQRYMPGRNSSIVDVFIDLLGIIIPLIYFKIKNNKKIKNNNLNSNKKT